MLIYQWPKQKEISSVPFISDHIPTTWSTALILLEAFPYS
jgi:hypothetical protein